DAAVVATRTREALARFGADPEKVSAEDAAGGGAGAGGGEGGVSGPGRPVGGGTGRGGGPAARGGGRRQPADSPRRGSPPRRAREVGGGKGGVEEGGGFAAFLGESPAIAVERRRQLLQAAVSRRPGDLGLLMTLGNTYSINQKEGADAGVRWYQAAVAAAPAN